MSKVTVREAALLVGKSRDTINEACRDGTLSSEKNEKGVKVIDVSELGRRFEIIMPIEELEKKVAKKPGADSYEPSDLRQKVAVLEIQLLNAERERDVFKAERERDRDQYVTQVQILTKALEQGGQAMKLLADQSAQKTADGEEIKTLKKAVRRVIQDNKILREENAKRTGGFRNWFKSGQAHNQPATHLADTVKSQG